MHCAQCAETVRRSKWMVARCLIIFNLSIHIPGMLPYILSLVYSHPGEVVLYSFTFISWGGFLSLEYSHSGEVVLHSFTFISWGGFSFTWVFTFWEGCLIFFSHSYPGEVFFHLSIHILGRLSWRRKSSYQQLLQLQLIHLHLEQRWCQNMHHNACIILVGHSLWYVKTNPTVFLFTLLIIILRE